MRDAGDERSNEAGILPFPSNGRRREPGADEPRFSDVLGEVLREERHRQERTPADVAEDAAVSLPLPVGGRAAATGRR